MYIINVLMACFVLIISFSSFGISTADELAPIEGTHQHKPTIIALSPHIVEMLFDIGAGDQIIGTTDFSDYPEQAKKIPRVGNYIRIQLERVIALQPDIVIAWKTGSPSDDLARLKQLGFNVVYSNPQHFEDIAKELRYFGQLTGHVKQANLVADKFVHDLTEIKTTYKNKKKITGFYELWDRPLTTVSSKSWPQQFFELCQMKNPFVAAEAPYPQVNIEEVLQQSIQIIIQPLSANQPDKKGFDWNKWPVIPAVKNNHIIKADADGVHRMTLRSVIALKKVCEDIDKTRINIAQDSRKPL